MMVLLILLLAVGAYGVRVAPLIEGGGGPEFENQYIVKVRSSVLVETFKYRIEQISEKLKKQSGGVYGQYTIESALLANPSVLFMKMDRKMLKRVRLSSLVGYVEEDGYNDPDYVYPPLPRAMPSSTWALDRINQVSCELDKDISFCGDGEGVNIYVLDSGINDQQQDFEGRAIKAYDVFNSTGNDCCKHGTAVAGAAASKTWGVAKKANIYSVRMLDCRCGAGTSHMVKAIDWVAEHAVLPCVATMSFSRKTTSPTICDAVQRLSEAGCIPIAAGTNYSPDKNQNPDACTRTPATCPHAITVGATTFTDDLRASFSRYGDCVDIFAPGDFVRTTSAADGKFEWRSGTSMSVPLVAGVAAIHLGNGVPASEVRHRILSDALSCKLPDAGRGSPNRFLYVDPAEPVENPEPGVVETGY